MNETNTIPDLLERAHLHILQARSDAATPAIRETLNDVIRHMDIAAVLAEEWDPHPKAEIVWDELLDDCDADTKWSTTDGAEFENARIERPTPDYLTDWCRVFIGKTMWLFRVEEDGDFDGEQFVDNSKWVLVRRFNL